eukprot:UN06061
MLRKEIRSYFMVLFLAPAPAGPWPRYFLGPGPARPRRQTGASPGPRKTLVVLLN